MERGEQDRQMVEEQEAIDKIKEEVDNNWIVGSEEELICGWFSDFRRCQQENEQTSDEEGTEM